MLYTNLHVYPHVYIYIYLLICFYMHSFTYAYNHICTYAHIQDSMRVCMYVYEHSLFLKGPPTHPSSYPPPMRHIYLRFVLFPISPRPSRLLASHPWIHFLINIKTNPKGMQHVHEDGL